MGTNFLISRKDRLRLSLRFLPKSLVPLFKVDGSLEGGAFWPPEAFIHNLFGPGYRVYFGNDEKSLVILLCGGIKGTQKKDIKSAKNYWQDYKG